MIVLNKLKGVSCISAQERISRVLIHNYAHAL